MPAPASLNDQPTGMRQLPGWTPGRAMPAGEFPRRRERVSTRSSTSCPEGGIIWPLAAGVRRETNFFRRIAGYLSRPAPVDSQ